ncbi:MAG: hypothetical protein SGPRY_002602 [Prymnesium sp.]
MQPDAAIVWNERQRAIVSENAQLSQKASVALENMLDRLASLRASPHTVISRAQEDSSSPAVEAIDRHQTKEDLKQNSPPSRAIRSRAERPLLNISLPSDGEESGVEEEEEEEARTLASLVGEARQGSTLGVHVPDELLPPEGGQLLYAWFRSRDGLDWRGIEGLGSESYQPRAEDVGCWLFAEWRFVDFEGSVLREGATEANVVKPLVHERMSLRDAILQGQLQVEASAMGGSGVHAPILGPSVITLSRKSVQIASRSGSGWGLPLRTARMTPAASDPLAIHIATSENERSLLCRFHSVVTRDLLLLCKDCFASLQLEPLLSGPCKLWESGAYKDFFALLFVEVLLLHEGSAMPSSGSEPAYIIEMLGCQVTDGQVESKQSNNFALTIEDSSGGVYHIKWAETTEYDLWCDAILSHHFSEEPDRKASNEHYEARNQALLEGCHFETTALKYGGYGYHDTACNAVTPLPK